MPNTNLFLIFLTGLTTGGLTCLAIQGGLLTSIIAQQENTLAKNKYLFPVISFLSGKLLIHTLLGFLLGALGQTLTLSPIIRGWLQIAIGFYLLGIAGNLLNLHPLFRYFVITPPKFLVRLTRNKAQGKSLFAPFLLGLFTVFIPCAVTQATEVVAIGTGKPLSGALIMFAFILGTMPTFILLGFLLQKSAHVFQKFFPQIAALALAGMSLYSINNGLGLTGSIYTIQNFIEVAKQNPSANSVLGDHIQTVTLTVTNTGYSPTSVTLKKGIPVRLTLITQNVQSCSRSFTIPALNIQELLPESGETVIDFTPETTDPLTFSCSMGMYTGRFNIID